MQYGTFCAHMERDERSHARIVQNRLTSFRMERIVQFYERPNRAGSSRVHRRCTLGTGPQHQRVRYPFRLISQDCQREARWGIAYAGIGSLQVRCRSRHVAGAYLLGSFLVFSAAPAGVVVVVWQLHSFIWPGTFDVTRCGEMMTARPHLFFWVSMFHMERTVPGMDALYGMVRGSTPRQGTHQPTPKGKP